MRAYGSNIGWNLGFELGWSVGMVMGAFIGCPLENSIGLFLGLAIFMTFFTWEEYLVGVSLGALGGLGIFTREGSLVGLSPGFPLGSPLGYPNPGVVLPGTLLGASHGLLFGSELIMYWCSCLYPDNFHKDTCAWGGG